MKKLIGAFALFFLAGCQTSPISPEDADPVPTSRLYALQEGGEAKSDCHPRQWVVRIWLQCSVVR